MTVSPNTSLWGLWIIWMVSWIGAARWSAETVSRQSVPDRLLHSLFIWSGTVLLCVRVTTMPLLAAALFPATTWTAWAGVILTGVGLGHTWWARIHLGRLWSGHVTLKVDHAIVRSGPYAWTRHPIYSGLLLAVVGTLLVRDDGAGLLGLGLFVVGLIMKIRQEERLLTGHFGEAYRAYRREVRALIPGVW